MLIMQKKKNYIELFLGPLKKKKTDVAGWVFIYFSFSKKLMQEVFLKLKR